MYLTSDSAVPLLGIYPIGILAHVYQETFGNIFIVAFFIKVEKARNN